MCQLCCQVGRAGPCPHPAALTFFACSPRPTSPPPRPAIPLPHKGMYQSCKGWQHYCLCSKSALLLCCVMVAIDCRGPARQGVCEALNTRKYLLMRDDFGLGRYSEWVVPGKTRAFQGEHVTTCTKERHGVSLYKWGPKPSTMPCSIQGRTTKYLACYELSTYPLHWHCMMTLL